MLNLDEMLFLGQNLKTADTLLNVDKINITNFFYLQAC